MAEKINVGGLYECNKRGLEVRLKASIRVVDGLQDL